jgi:hypothetical protein
MIESRKSARRPVRQGAWIFRGGGAATIPCVMMDLSGSGARLRVDAETELPAQFILVMSRDGRLNRRCRTVWRDNDMIGVQFLGRQSLGPAPVAMPRLGVPMPEEDEAPAAEATEAELAAAIATSNEAAQT